VPLQNTLLVMQSEIRYHQPSHINFR